MPSMNFLESLADYYDTEADKFHQTRQRHRPEFDILVAEIKKRFPRKKNLRVLELGCWSGRLLTYLQKKLPTKELIYTGVDISKGLISIAKKDHPDATRKVGNMTEFLCNTKQESFDIIIGIASFHHLPSMAVRTTTANHMYKALAYDGMCFMTNWSDSDRFRKRFRSSIYLAIWKSIVSFGIYRPNDLFLPWKSEKLQKTFYRYYHIFSLKELERIAKMAWFGHIEQFYLTADGEQTLERKNSRNSCSMRAKEVFID